MAATRAPQPANGPAATKPSREEKKVGKRAKQLAAMDAKAQAEGRYFQEQQAAMQRSGEASKELESPQKSELAKKSWIPLDSI